MYALKAGLGGRAERGDSRRFARQVIEQQPQPAGCRPARGVDQRTGRYFDDTKPYVDGVPGITDSDKKKIFQDNALKVYPRLKNYLKVAA